MCRVVTLVFCFVFGQNIFAKETKSSEERELVWLLVDKEKLSATLYTLPLFPKDPVSLQTFRIAIGKQRGDKNKRGDNKTPEGIYFTQHYRQNLYVKKYGNLAIPLDFPNVMDVMDNKTGYGIWLHGEGEENRVEAANVTQGCVAFYNNDILKLKSWLVPKQGMVLIAPDSKDVNLHEDRKQVHELTEQWIDSWSKRDLDRYMSFYSDKFSSERKNKAQYEKYKSRVFKSYKDMKVSMRTLRVLTHPKYAIAVMNQNFNGDNHYVSNGRKVLYWQKEAGSWKIVRETFADVSLSKLELTEANLNNLKAQ